uniref:Polycomb protein VEFS-Box domain-containing protein n=1 Tax=Rhizochromulina marina TaxID=1034831 RepID=A0A7S2RPM2_9STRA
MATATEVTEEASVSVSLEEPILLYRCLAQQRPPVLLSRTLSYRQPLRVKRRRSALRWFLSARLKGWPPVTDEEGEAFACVILARTEDGGATLRPLAPPLLLSRGTPLATFSTGFASTDLPPQTGRQVLLVQYFAPRSAAQGDAHAMAVVLGQALIQIQQLPADPAIVLRRADLSLGLPSAIVGDDLARVLGPPAGVGTLAFCRPVGSNQGVTKPNTGLPAPLSWSPKSVAGARKLTLHLSELLQPPDKPKRDVANGYRLLHAPALRAAPTTVVYHLIHGVPGKMEPQVVVKHRPGCTCLLCGAKLPSSEALLTHLASSHDRFTADASVVHGKPGVLHVSLQPAVGSGILGGLVGRFYPVKDEEDGEEADADQEQLSLEPHDAFIMSNKGRTPPVPETLVTIHNVSSGGDTLIVASEATGRGKKRPRVEKTCASLQPSLEARAADQGVFLPVRQYYHSRTGAPMAAEEFSYDSDEEIDESWMVELSEKLLDEFEDVSTEEKAFMKLWNSYVRDVKILADFQLPIACARFAADYQAQLADPTYRFNFLLHLFNLWDNSLLTSTHISQCMRIVDFGVDA